MSFAPLASLDSARPDAVRLLARLQHAAHDEAPLGRARAEVLREAPARTGQLLVRLHAQVAERDRATRSLISVAGVVAEVGDGVTGFAVGDEVFGVARDRDRHLRDGTAHAIASAVRLAKAPRTLTPAQSAACAGSAVTAWQMLFRHGRVEAGETVVVLTSRHPVGVFALQLARAYGVHAIAVSSPEDTRVLQSLGAQRVADTRSGALEAACRVGAVVIDTLGGLAQMRALFALQGGSALLSCASRPDVSWSTQPGIRAEFITGDTVSRDLARIAELLDAGHLAPLPAEWAR